MEVTVALVVFLILAVGMLFMLGAGYANTEKERGQQAQARQAAAARASAIATVPGFFQTPQPASTPVPIVFDDGLVIRLENHVRAEQALVAPFVHQPSIANLYRQSAAARPLH